MNADPKILIVNPDPHVIKILRQILESGGFSCITEAATGSAAIDELSNNTVDILVTDVLIDQMDGWQLARLVRSGALKASPDTPILMVSTTYSERIAEVAAKECEINRFIPYEQREQLAAAVREIATDNAGIPKSTLLIIEDHPDTVTLIKRVLSKRFDIQVATDGKSGLTTWKEHRHDLVLLDVMLPSMSGNKVLENILEVHPGQSVVVMTAYSSAKRAGALIVSGAVDFISKPFRADQLRRVCEIALHREDFIISNEQFSRRLEEQRKSEGKNKRLIEALSVDHYFYTQDVDGFITYISPSITNVLGYSPDEYIRCSPEYFTDSPVNKEALRRREQTFTGKSQSSYECEMFHKDGSCRKLEVTETPILDEGGNLIATDAIVHDISERDQMQIQLQQAQKMEAIGQLTGGIAHDFNNILASIMGYTSMALEKVTDDGGKLHSYLAEVYSAGERARDLIGQMLAFSRGTATYSQPLEFAPLINEGVKMLRATLPTTINLRIDLDKDAPSIMMDPVQLHQLVMNLCINARDAIKGSKGQIDIQLKRATNICSNCSSCLTPLTGNFMELTVKDNGSGIDEKLLNKIFDPFYTTKEVGKGSGMGLSMAHGIVHEHGGHILVETEPGKGTAFRLLFPLLVKPTSLATKANKNIVLNKTGARIMVVDDDPVVSGYLHELLESKGYIVTSLTNPRDALNLYNQNPQAVDLLLTDQMMPALTGDKLARAMLEKRPELPVIMCTGYSDIMDASMAEKLKIRGFLRKPMEAGALTSMISSLLNNGGQKTGM